ncbi:MAG TPA: hypothetical protein VLT16_00580 [Candidatus Limnocylindrales bacterium]|nr:hypothetical protein [Candidatus Limnocylindrales bacterium]
MNAEQKELFRKGILRVLEANNTRFGLGVPAVCHSLAVFGFPDPSAADVQDGIEYLAGKGLVDEVMKYISRENRAWRISQKGIAFLDEGH